MGSRRAHPLGAKLQKASSVILGSNGIFPSLSMERTQQSSVERREETSGEKQDRFTVKLMELKLWDPSLA